MKIYYKTAKETIELEVEEKWGEIVNDLNQKEKNRKTVARRHEVYSADSESDIFDSIGALDPDLEMVQGCSEENPAQMVNKALSLMKPKQAGLLRAVYMEGISQESLASFFGVSKSAVSQRVKAARENFKKIYSSLNKEEKSEQLDF